jgi:hypothetical protein
VVDILVDRHRDCRPHHGVGKLRRTHRISVGLPMSELPVHVRLVEKADAGHNACSHPAVAQSLDLDQVGRVVVLVNHSVERHDVEGRVVRVAQQFHDATVPHDKRCDCSMVCKSFAANADRSSTEPNQIDATIQVRLAGARAFFQSRHRVDLHWRTSTSSMVNSPARSFNPVIGSIFIGGSTCTEKPMRLISFQLWR